MSYELYLEIVYQLRLLDKLIAKENNPIKLTKYEGMREALLFVLEQESKL